MMLQQPDFEERMAARIAARKSAMDESKLTERDKEVLRALRWNGDEWSRPMDVGGGDGSHHSRTLAKLHKLGFAERTTYYSWSRNVHKYRAIKTPNAKLTG